MQGNPIRSKIARQKYRIRRGFHPINKDLFFKKSSWRMGELSRITGSLRIIWKPTWCYVCAVVVALMSLLETTPLLSATSPSIKRLISRLHTSVVKAIRSIKTSRVNMEELWCMSWVKRYRRPKFGGNQATSFSRRLRLSNQSISPAMVANATVPSVGCSLDWLQTRLYQKKDLLAGFSSKTETSSLTRGHSTVGVVGLIILPKCPYTSHNWLQERFNY